MGEIPEDIMKEATKACHRNDFASRRYNGMPSDVCLMVATAIHAERERCAKIADEHALKCSSKINKKRSDHDLAVFESAAFEAESIAASIRGGN